MRTATKTSAASKASTSKSACSKPVGKPAAKKIRTAIPDDDDVQIIMKNIRSNVKSIDKDVTPQRAAALTSGKM